MNAVASKPVLQVSCLLQDSEYPTVWRWLNEFPESNFDDYGPKTEAEFTATLKQRQANVGVQYVFNFRQDKDLVGLIGFAFLNPEVGQLQGALFPKSVHRTGLPQEAFTMFLKLLRTLDVRKLVALYPEDNENIKRFLLGFGFVTEGALKAHTKRNGKLTDVEQVALFLR